MDVLAKQVGQSAKVELERRYAELLNQKGGRLESVFRTAIMADSISRQCGTRLHNGIDKQTLDAMTQSALEQANQGNMSAWKVFRFAIGASAAQGVGAVTGFSNAGAVAGGFLGAFKSQEEMRYSLQKTLGDHKVQQLRLIADQHRDEAGRARGVLTQLLRMLRETAQEESGAKSSMLRSSAA